MVQNSLEEAPFWTLSRSEKRHAINARGRSEHVISFRSTSEALLRDIGSAHTFVAAQQVRRCICIRH